MPKHFLEQRWPWLVAAGVVVIAFGATFLDIELVRDWEDRPTGSVEDIETLAERKPNVLFVVVDTLRADRLGSYGYERDTSPMLDRMASSGVRFDRHLSQSSWTKASMASLWTGLYPARTGIHRYNDVIPPEASTAAEVLHDAGFQTVGLYRNGWVAPTFGFDQGFEVYQRPPARPLPPKVRRENPTLGERGSDEAFVDTALEFLRINGHRRWFLYLHLMDLHEYVYDEESAQFGSSYSDIYDNSIRWTDGTLQVLVNSLAAQGHLDNTVIAVTSDHGEAFLERGFEGHARRVYRETTEVPLLISFPFRLEPGVVVETRTRNVDVWPTILDLLGLEPPLGIDGQSRRPDILASASGQVPEDTTRTAIADLDQTWGRRDAAPRRTVAVVQDTLRYVRVEQAPAPPIEHLYDAKDDPDERHDLAAEDPETLERLRGVADTYSEQQPSWGEAPTRELGELELNLLRALGYVVE